MLKIITITGKVKSIILYLFTIILSLGIFIFITKLWRSDLHIPLSYGGDALFTAEGIKSIIDNGWHLQNSKVGLPYGLNMYDFPTSDNLFYLIIKFLSLFTDNWALIINIFYILTFPLTSLIATFVLRQFNLAHIPSLVGGVLYAFIPYHFFRGLWHLFLSAYFVIPLVIMVALWVFSGDYFTYGSNIRLGRFRFSINSKKLIVSIVICILAGASGIYYAFFSCFFIIVAGFIASFNKRKWHNISLSFILVLVISITVLANILPSIIYQYNFGKNSFAAVRSIAESEIYGMKIAQLLLPVSGHRIQLLSKITQRYIMSAPLVNENQMASLGFVGSIGFLSLLIILFIEKGKRDFTLLKNLSYLNISAVLLGSLGAFGVIFAAIISPQIRAYNRISIFISFFSIFAFLQIIKIIKEEFNSSKIIDRVFTLLFIGILIIGIFDQTTTSFIPDYEGVKVQYISDQKFVSELEASIPKLSKVFQLPYVPFPENPPVNKMTDYDLFKGYMHSKTLSWSYGAMKGRESDMWQKDIISKPIDDFIETLSLAGFAGIYIDRYGYVDNGEDIESKIENILKIKPIESPDKRLIFYNMTSYNKYLKDNMNQVDFSKKQDIAVNPLILTWTEGFSNIEVNEERNWRWCSDTGELIINNTSEKERKISIKMTIFSGYDEYSNLILKECINLNEKVNSSGLLIEKEVILTPGKNKIEFSCDAKRVDAPGDPRVLVFRVNDFDYKNID